MHTLTEVEGVQGGELRHLSQAGVCHGAGDQAVVAAQGKLLKHSQRLEVCQFLGTDILQAPRAVTDSKSLMQGALTVRSHLTRTCLPRHQLQ